MLSILLPDLKWISTAQHRDKFVKGIIESFIEFSIHCFWNDFIVPNQIWILQFIDTEMVDIGIRCRGSITWPHSHTYIVSNALLCTVNINIIFYDGLKISWFAYETHSTLWFHWFLNVVLSILSSNTFSNWIHSIKTANFEINNDSRT